MPFHGDVSVLVSRRGLLYMWKATFLFFFIQEGVLSYIVMQSNSNVFALICIIFYLRHSMRKFCQMYASLL